MNRPPRYAGSELREYKKRKKPGKNFQKVRANFLFFRLAIQTTNIWHDDRSCRIGEASHPGPPDAHTTTVRVRTINVTSAGANQTAILQQEADILAIQEHCVDDGAAARFQAAAKLEGWHSNLGPTDPEHIKKAAGVGFLWKDTIDLIPITPLTEDYNDAITTGRFLIMQFETAEKGPT